MKNGLSFFVLIVMVTQSCTYGEYEIPKLKAELKLSGSAIDTVYLYTIYKDKGATVFEDLDHDGVESCRDNLPVTAIYNDVNTNLPGIYSVTYSGKDSSGKMLNDVTRKVVVVQNSSTFLNGNYNVTCSCVVIPKGSTEPLLSAENYTAAITSATEKDRFELSALEIGGEKVVLQPFLHGDSIHFGYYSPNFQLTNDDGGYGKLSVSKDTFTIQTIAYSYQPVQTIRCTNIYSKQVIIRK